MAISVSKACVLKIYQDVMEDVIMNVRDLFLEDGVDEQVLQELQQSWETKLLASKAVDNRPPELDKIVERKPIPINQPTTFIRNPQQLQGMQHALGHIASNNRMQPSLGQMPAADVKMVPVQITLPPQPGTDGGQRVLTIQVPSTALQGNQLHRALTGPVITATMGLPVQIASTILQSHVDSVLNSQQQVIPSTSGFIATRPPVQTDGTADDSSSDDENSVSVDSSIKTKSECISKLCIVQTDGPIDSSDEDDDPSEDDDGSDEVEEDKEDENDIDEEGGAEEEPLNSEDDVTDEDTGDQFDTENVVVCQYDKITRSRNKWKFHLKDGIMNCNNEDYVFQKANGDAEW